MASLYGEDLSGVDLRGAKLNYAELPEANLSGANLTGASLNFANLVDANLTNANLHTAQMNYANMHRAILTGADMSESFQFGANSTGVTFGNAPIGMSSLAVTTKSAPRQTNMSQAVLSSANLRGSSFVGVNLTGANFQNSNLQNVSFKNATLVSASFTGATWSNTICADGTNSDGLSNGCPTAAWVEPETGTGQVPPTGDKGVVSSAGATTSVKASQTRFSIPSSLKRGKTLRIGAVTAQGKKVTIRAKGKCSVVTTYKKVKAKKVIAGYSVKAATKKGTCTLSINAPATGNYAALAQKSVIAIK